MLILAVHGLVVNDALQPVFSVKTRGSEPVRALVRRLLQSPLPCGVLSGLVRPLFRGVGVGSRVFWWLAGVVFWPCLFWLCAIGTRTILRFARKKKSTVCSVKKCINIHALRAFLGLGGALPTPLPGDGGQRVRRRGLADAVCAALAEAA